ncbi:PH domain-containing protein [Streptosporangium sp. OZ121]|uniref:PH domain-containing protein n=1 Tax=Streptosporangium sp. OZ121 TaxID=3444183 RepID=UPI003F79737C
MKQVFRSTLATVVGWVWMAFAAFNAVDLIARYSGQASMVAAAVLGVLTALVFVTCLRPAVILSEDGVRVRNPLRNAFVPWRAVDEVTVSHSITIISGGGRVRCWVPQASARERAAAARRGRSASAPVPARGRFRTEPVRSKGERAAAEALAGKTHADWVAEQITERAEAARRAASMAEASKAAGASTAPGTPAATGTPAEPGAGTTAGVEAGTGTGTGAGALKVTWAPSALAAFAVAALPVVAAFLA